MSQFFNTDAWDKTKPYPERAKMIEYLLKHFRYFTMNSWNRVTSFANNVKLYYIGLEDEGVDLDKAFDFLYSENPEYTIEVDMLINDFTRNNPHISVGFNGRSGGYIVMYMCERTSDGYKTFPGRGYCNCNSADDLHEYLKEASDDEVKSLFEDVKSFDTLCDEIRDTFIHYVKSSRTRQIMYMEPTERSVSFCPDESDCVDEGLDRILKETVPNYTIYVQLDPMTHDYAACVPQLEISGITGESMELTVMRAELAILEYLDEHHDAPAPAGV